jgi:hypothetical protein
LDAIGSACRNQEDVASQMFSLCNRAMKANPNWLKSLKRRDPKRERGGTDAGAGNAGGVAGGNTGAKGDWCKGDWC